jgi:hypothetical protein
MRNTSILKVICKYITRIYMLAAIALIQTGKL